MKAGRKPCLRWLYSLHTKSTLQQADERLSSLHTFTAFLPLSFNPLPKLTALPFLLTEISQQEPSLDPTLANLRRRKCTEQRRDGRPPD